MLKDYAKKEGIIFIDVNSELSIADFKSMGGKEHIREDGRKEIVI